MSAEQKLPLFDGPIEVEGVVERVIFHNADNGFTVLKVLVPPAKGQSGDDILNCVGHISLPRQGARFKFRGRFVKNAKYGHQLSFENAEEVMPATTEGLIHYLASGLIKGVGMELATRIVGKFGEDTIRVLDEEPELLNGVRGVGKKNFERITTAWNEHRGMRDLLLFLQPHGITAAYAIRIYRAYGADAKKVVRENPYRLAMDIRGIGFLTADSIAAKLGFKPDHPLRIQAAVLYVLQKASDDGHVFLPEAELIKRVAKEAGATPDQTLEAIACLDRDERICLDYPPESAPDGRAIYLSRYHHCEAQIAFYLKRLLRSPKSAVFNNPEVLLAKALQSMPMRLAPEQIEATRAAMKAKALVITGGPGTGKTTIIKAVIKLFEAVKAKILLASPTGRAAKRMAEACGKDAKTIHRLLEYSPKDDRFAKNEDNPLACGLLVVDEASMMDTLLFYYLLKALPLGATLVLVGDVHQLPSVGPGNVLGDIIASRVIPVVELNEIFRQSAQSEIICNAHLINRGQMPMLETNANKKTDFYFIPKDNPEEAADLIVDLIKTRIPRGFGYDPINQIQLLTPMRKGAVGAERMNSRLQEALNPNALEIRRGDRAFRLHDKVMQVRNNYDKDIFNGDIGRIVYLDSREREMSVDFDGLVMTYSFDELDELMPAYAISIHKSQGSEYPAVVIPLLMQHYVLLQRNLVYTGVTRGKRLVVLVGERRALEIAIHNNKTSLRHTMLAQRLTGL